MDSIQQEIDGINLTPPNFSLERLEKLGDFITADQNMGTVSWIASIIKLACAIAYIIAWNILAKNSINDKKKKLESLIRMRQNQSNEVVD